jgi:hypothetical protein
LYANYVYGLVTDANISSKPALRRDSSHEGLPLPYSSSHSSVQIFSIPLTTYVHGCPYCDVPPSSNRCPDCLSIPSTSLRVPLKPCVGKSGQSTFLSNFTSTESQQTQSLPIIVPVHAQSAGLSINSLLNSSEHMQNLPLSLNYANGPSTTTIPDDPDISTQLQQCQPPRVYEPSSVHSSSADNSPPPLIPRPSSTSTTQLPNQVTDCRRLISHENYVYDGDDEKSERGTSLPPYEYSLQ